MREALLFVMVMILTNSGCGRSSGEEVKPGKGVGEFVVGETKLTARLNAPETRERYDKAGLSYFSADGEVVSAVAVFGKQYHTVLGARVGSTVQQVQTLYGEGVRRPSNIMSGDTVLGKFADYGLVYPGIAFVVSEERVIAIVVSQDY